MRMRTSISLRTRVAHLNISALAVEQSWFWYLSAPSMERLWLPRSLAMAALACPLAVRGRDPDLGQGGCRTLEGPKYCRVVSYLKEIQIVL